MAHAASTEPAYLAFDLGASSCRAILGRMIEGRMEMEDVHRFETPVIEDDGRLYWEIDVLWRELERGAHLARERAPFVRSLSVDSWGVDYVPLDEAGIPVRRPYAYRDPRVTGMLARAETRVPRARIYAETGIQFMEINTLYQVLADLEYEPDLVRQVRNRLTIADYFNYRFSGRPVEEISLASTTQLLNARTHQWSSVLLEAFGLEATAWPELVKPGTRLGLAQGLPGVEVVAGCSHDTACAVAAAPASDGGGAWAYLSCGTWSLLGVELNEPLLDDRALASGFTNEAGLDGTVRFLKNMTGLWLLQECERVWRARGDRFTYAQLLAEADAARPPDALVDVDDPRFAPRGDMPERLAAYCSERGFRPPATRGEAIRLVLESMAAGHRRTLRYLEETIGRPIDTLHMVGGGSQNDLLCQLTADACGCRLVAGPSEATALGNLLIQARTMGDLAPDESIRDVVRRSVQLRAYVGRQGAAPGEGGL